MQAIRYLRLTCSPAAPAAQSRKKHKRAAAAAAAATSLAFHVSLLRYLFLFLLALLDESLRPGHAASEWPVSAPRWLSRLTRRFPQVNPFRRQVSPRSRYRAPRLEVSAETISAMVQLPITCRPENILYRTNDEHSDIVIADFGM